MAFPIFMCGKSQNESRFVHEKGDFLIHLSAWEIAAGREACGALSSNRAAADDDPMKLMSIALKPLCEPPFPLEKMQEMTARMGGEGELRW